MQPHSVLNVWTKEGALILKEIGSSEEVGLSEKEAAERLKTYSFNSFGEGRSRSPLWLLLRQFASPLIIILMIAAFVTLIFHEWVDAIFIFLAVSASVGLGFYQEYKAERATEALKSYIEERVRVLRGGREMEIESRNIVPGDIVILRAGERIPADGRILESHDLTIDESILTGESLPVLKSLDTFPENTPLSERDNMIFGGTYVAEGQGIAVITATASFTEFGKIAEAVLKQGNIQTPLQKAVTLMGYAIAAVILVLIAGVYGLGISRGMEHLDIFLIGVAIAVGAIPEALPPGLTAILAVGVERIAKKKGIVRSLLAVETLGSTTVILTDKTGTLTTGNLELKEVIGINALIKKKSTGDKEEVELLTLASANIDVIIDGTDKKPEKWSITGRHLDVAIAKEAAKRGVAVDKISTEATPIKLFSSSHKYSIYNFGKHQTVLGAPDILLKHSDLTPEVQANLIKEIEEQSYAGRRLLGVGEVVGDNTGDDFKIKFLGLLSFYDPLRKNMKEAIAEIENSGVKVLMATGDLPGTAASIAKNLGWTEGEKEILTGEDLRLMTDAELEDALDRVRVLARMTPEDKYRVVEMLEAKGEVVAMLGDGVNDAPSLKRASIGVAVGSGTDVAKGVADLVLLDDNFFTIKAAIDEGKLILSNIRKTFVYLMSNSLDEVVLLGGSLAIGLTLPLSPLQIIWVNFVTGSIPAIAYAFDKERQSHRAKEHAILSREVITLSFGIGAISSISLLVLYYLLASVGGDSAVERTFLFACFSSYILFVAFSFRNLNKPLFTYPIFGNKVLNFGVVFGIIMLLATIYLPFFQNLFGTVALPATWFGYVLLWIIANVAMVEGAKWMLVHGTHRKV
ncbi:MAG: HAD-IC family P-type ATPase [Candidatus Paceibacterota bacterium]